MIYLNHARPSDSKAFQKLIDRLKSGQIRYDVTKKDGKDISREGYIVYDGRGPLLAEYSIVNDCKSFWTRGKESSKIIWWIGIELRRTIGALRAPTS